VFSYRWREGENLFFRRHPVTLVVNSLLPILLGVGILWGIPFSLHLGYGIRPVAHTLSPYLLGLWDIVLLGRRPLAFLGLDFRPLYGWEAFFDGLG
jgi:hypothetical protein